MPAAPEFADGESKVGAFKVCHQFDAKKLRAADGDVRIAGEIAVNFDGEHDRDNDKDKTDIAVCPVVYFVYGGGEDVRDHQFFKISPGHQFEPVSCAFIVETSFLFELRQKGTGPPDGASQKLWEEGDKEGIKAEVPLRLDFSPIYVNQISHGLEEVKGNARRQQDFYGHRLQGKTIYVDQGVYFCDGGSAQLKEQKDSHKGKNAAPKTAFFCSRIRRPFQPQRQKVGQQGGKKEQKPISHMKIHVESVACRQQKNPPEFYGYNIIQNKYRRQKDGEGH